MSLHLDREINKLRNNLIILSAQVEDNLFRASDAVIHRDHNSIVEVSKLDTEINQREVELEENCLKVLALHQPVAIDLRIITTILHTNRTLERIGDLAVNLAKKARRLANTSELKISPLFYELAERVRAMLHQSIDAFVELETSKAMNVIHSDLHVNQLKKKLNLIFTDMIRSNIEEMDACVAYMGAVRNLERAADMSVNIAEDVVYLVDGRVIRHLSDH